MFGAVFRGPQRRFRAVAPLPLQCAIARSILPIHERKQLQIRGRSRAQEAGKAPRGLDCDRRPDQGREPCPAPTPGDAHCGACEPAAEERAGACAGGGDDRPAEVHGAGMSDNQARVSVRILEKEYHITCPLEERSDLLDSAEFLNSKMREIRDTGKVVGLDRIAVIAALNMANELIRFRNRDTNLDSDVGGRLRILRERVESALEKGRQLEL